MRIIGITGGIGVGKSTVLGILAKKNFYILNADIIAKDIVSKGQTAYLSILEKFGRNILNKENEIDRKILGNIVFNDKKLLKDLNSIIHPEVIKNIKNAISNILKEKQYAGIAVEAVVPVKEFRNLCDEIWLVESELNIVIDRVLKRDSLNKKDIDDRINSQKEIKYNSFDNIIIKNNGSIEDLESQIMKLLNN